jgi:hypothetical protein
MDENGSDGSISMGLLVFWTVSSGKKHLQLQPLLISQILNISCGTLSMNALSHAVFKYKSTILILIITMSSCSLVSIYSMENVYANNMQRTSHCSGFVETKGLV